jgi:hypothetical protein
MLQAYLWLIWRFHPQTRPDCDRGVAFVRSCRHAHNAALCIAIFFVFGVSTSTVTGGAEWRLANGVSLLAKFDGEFANRSQTYSGTGRIRYAW